MKIPSTKIQISNNYQCPKFKIQNRLNNVRHPIRDCNVLVIGIFRFGIVCNLSIGIWDLNVLSEKIYHLYLNQFELVLTLARKDSFYTLQGIRAVLFNPFIIFSTIKIFRRPDHEKERYREF